MKRTLLEVYALAVCFVTVGCFVIAFGIALYGAIGVAQPGFTLSGHTYEMHRTNDRFFNRQVFMPDEEKQQRVRPPEAELTRQRQESLAAAIDGERRDSAQTTVKSMIVVLIDLLVFFVHWRIARSPRMAAV